MVFVEASPTKNKKQKHLIAWTKEKLYLFQVKLSVHEIARYSSAMRFPKKGVVTVTQLTKLGGFWVDTEIRRK